MYILHINFWKINMINIEIIQNIYTYNCKYKNDQVHEPDRSYNS